MGGACAADWNDNAAVEEYCEVGPNNDLTNNLDAQIQLFLAEGFASQVGLLVGWLVIVGDVVVDGCC